MKHAVILAHPKPTSFNASIAKACAERLSAKGQEVVVRDLYAMNFDPCLKAEEIPTDSSFAPGPDVVAERALLADVDSFIFVYPLWFNAPPAILKGYVDRVFSMGFGYAPGMDPLLDGKTLLTFSTSGAPDSWVRSTEALTTLMNQFDVHLASVSGLRVIDHIHFGGILSNLNEEAAEDMLQQVRRGTEQAFLP